MGNRFAYFKHMTVTAARPKVMTDGQAALWAWMDRRGVNQRETARLLEIHYVTLNAILTGRKKPGLAVAVKIEQHTGINTGVWVRTAVRDSARHDPDEAVNHYKSLGYGHAS
jgi:plasmid maintenance system antidote protein VapI